ncbi:efflux RND transporter periplasmic adaptor subunit [Pontibacter cellulosilyticus]|uniref:Efflux RND transporter periplasmic adaptor subunit n=1 Tax=Pontibacter cellulosilyticus TaxID=1720253 RepID=A0A923SHF9_9BACT|nr:efflux RND transporter periplasmic adaptor subunit [Pontibacter cellulosilyticus]MBC5991704.1 efflux RND transporter periplasmic adaptor subunit [Pontibacter cellulosilyticus]
MAKRKSNLIPIIAGVLVLLIIGIIVAKMAGWIGKEEGTEVVIAEAKKTEIVEKVSASGKIQPETEVKISPDVSGEIIELNVEEGDSVVKGQLLLRIRPDNYQSFVDAQQASVNSSRANLAQTKARLAQAQANLTQAKQNYERNKSLYDQKVISQAEWQQIAATYESAKQEVESLRQSVRASEYNIQNALASLKDARENLNKTTIYAPVSGIVSKLNVERGERVVGTSQMAGTEIMRIANLNNMEVRVNVNENDIIRVALGDSVEVEVDSYASRDEKFKGVVTAIANTAKDAATLEAVTEFEVRIRLLNESYDHLAKTNARPFRPGMTASVDIITERKPNILSVPLSAVTTRSNENEKVETEEGEDEEAEQNTEEDKPKAPVKVEEVVFVYDKGTNTVNTVKVKTGISDFENIEIISGIKPGQEVVVGPFRAVSTTLKDGTKVAVKDAKSLDKSAIAAEGND